MALKMYILIKDSVDIGHAVLAAAHASLSGYLTFKDNPMVEDWVKNSFRKVICKVNQQEFDKAKTYGEAGKDYRVMTESSLNNDEIAIVFSPKEEWEKFFKFLKLYK